MINEKFVITKHYGPDIIYSVRKDNKRLKYIDIDDIRKKTVRGRENLEVLYRMKTISLYLKELNKMGVPMDMVENATKREFSLIRHNNKRI